MVLTATAPALVTASHAATIAGLLPERSSTRLPGLTPKSSTSACASRLRPVGQLLVGAAAAVADQRRVVAEALLDHAVGQLDGGVEVLGILELRPVEQQVGPLLGRRQIVAREGVDVAGRAEVGGALGCGLALRVANSLANIVASYALPLPACGERAG